MGNLGQDQDASVGNRILGSTGGHWETISASFSISFGSGLEVPSQYASVVQFMTKISFIKV